MKLDTLQVESVAILDQPFSLAPDTNYVGMVRRNTIKFAITLEPDEDGFILASCPALPGCHSQGTTREEAIVNITEAIRGYTASMRKHGEPIPVTDIEQVEVTV